MPQNSKFIMITLGENKATKIQIILDFTVHSQHLKSYLESEQITEQ